MLGYLDALMCRNMNRRLGWVAVWGSSWQATYAAGLRPLPAVGDLAASRLFVVSMLTPSSATALVSCLVCMVHYSGGYVECYYNGDCKWWYLHPYCCQCRYQRCKFQLCCVAKLCSDMQSLHITAKCCRHHQLIQQDCSSKAPIAVAAAGTVTGSGVMVMPFHSYRESVFDRYGATVRRSRTFGGPIMYVVGLCF